MHLQHEPVAMFFTIFLDDGESGFVQKKFKLVRKFNFECILHHESSSYEIKGIGSNERSVELDRVSINCISTFKCALLMT